MRTLTLTLLLALALPCHAAPAPFLLPQGGVPAVGTVFHWGWHEFKVVRTIGHAIRFESADPSAYPSWHGVMDVAKYLTIVRREFPQQED